jgi:two-component system NtrC family sensor kinase
MLPIVDQYYQDHPDLKIARLKYDFFREHINVLVDDMAHGSERIKGIVEGLRDFTRKDEGLLTDQVEINTLVEATTRLVHKEVHKHAKIKLDLGDNLPSFKGNAQKIEQVLVNLIVNAGQAIPEEKRGLITVRTWKQNSDIVVQIEDNGRGMNEKTMKQIFDPFFTTKRDKGGTGLGLAIAFRIVEEHGGNISVSSKPGKGTTFTVKIPVIHAQENKEGK